MQHVLRLASSASRISSSRVSSSLVCASRAYASQVQRVGVLGGGQMGMGIGQVAAMADKDVVVVDVSQAQLDRGVSLVEKLLAKAVGKGKLEQAEAESARKRLTVSTSLEDLRDVDLVVEAATEREELKLELFQQLDDVVQKKAILASNTSSISITRIGAATQRPEQVVGMHFMNPVPVMKLVEVIPSLATSSATLATTLQLAEELGKTTAVSKDSPGFIANRLLMPYINEAAIALHEGLGTREDIDTTMKLGCNMPMGPLALADFIGLDTCLAIMRVLHSQLGDSKYRPAHLLVQYVDAGYLGKKSGRGFFSY